MDSFQQLITDRSAVNQPHDMIKKIGNEQGREHWISFYYEDFRTGWKEGIQISKEMELYRQKYCGCIFSEKERYMNK